MYINNILYTHFNLLILFEFVTLIRGADHPPPSKRRGHERVGLYLYSPSGPSWPVIGRNFTVFTFVTLTAGIAQSV